MKISNHSILMQSSSTFKRNHESFANKQYFAQIAQEKQNQEAPFTNSFDISTSRTSKIAYNNEDRLSIEDRIKKILIEILLGRFCNKDKIEVLPTKKGISVPLSNTNPYTSNSNLSQGRSMSTWGFVFESKETYYQKSSISFNVNASIKTANSQFDFNVNFSYSQEFYEVHHEKLQFAMARFNDPLVINFGEDIKNFNILNETMNFHFDINNDGKEESLPMLNKGFGFLSLDKNKNGRIDDGNELFGPNHGNGFEELKEYDTDNNDWIDENDSIFKDLRVWEIDDKNGNSLITLGKAGIGAIYLAGIDTNYDYYKSIQQQTAKVTQASIALKENGQAKLVTNMNFVV